MKKRFFILVICFVMLAQVFVFTACNRNQQSIRTVTVTDMVGDVVVVPKNPQKVGVLARSAADMLVAFGLGDKITGVFETIFDNEWASIVYPNLSNYASYSYQTTFETYLEHGVEMIFAPEQHYAQNFREHSIPSVTVSQYGNPTYDDYVFYFADMVTQIWDDPAVKSKVDGWIAEFTAVRNEITTTLANVEQTKTMYYVRGDRGDRDLRYTENSPSTMQGTIGRYLKLDYISANFTTNRPTAETLLEIDPDYIFVGGAFQHKLISEAKTDSVWSNLSAIKNDNIFKIGIGFVAFEQNGVGLTIYLANMANKVYPDKFNFDINKMLKDTMQNYFGATLSDNDINNMLNGLNRNGQPLA